MKTIIKAVAFTAVAAVLLTGCAKPPAEEKAATKAAIDQCVKLEGETYGAQELASIKSQMAAAETEEKTQEAKFFKNFDKEKEILAGAKKAADALAVELPKRKEAAKQAAAAALADAKAALDAANALLPMAPKGKDTKAEIEALKADLAGVAAALPQVDDLNKAEKFIDAKAKAEELKAKAAGVGAQLQSAIDKVKAAKGSKKKK